MKNKWTIEYLRKNGYIAYEYIRGSVAYGTNLVDENGNNLSDEDHGGVFIAPPEMIMGLRSQYVEQVADEKNDVVFYEFGRWIELILKANPTALESLFIPKDCIIGEVHPAVQYILNHRDAFVSKECFNTFYGYAVSQIGKARGLNKKIVNPVEERKGVLDFCYVPYNQGTKKVSDWLRDYGLKQKYCGLVALPNMHDNYGLYYDWGTHIICEYGVDLRDKEKMIELYHKLNTIDEVAKYSGYKSYTLSFIQSWNNHLEHRKLFGNNEELFTCIEPYGFGGIVSETSDSNDVRVCTVPKHEVPLIIMSYNKSGYESHCRDYHDYQEWKKNRNEVRYEGNLGHNYDSKNIMHCMRLIRMAKELAQGKGFNVRRTEDREYLLSIRNHQFEYEDIMAQVENEKREMEEAIKTCTLPEHVNIDEVHESLIEARRKYVFSDMKLSLDRYVQKSERIV